MSNTVIIIPSRLKAKRLPDKPLKLINGKEMIIHVHDVAKKSGAGEVLVATADKEIHRLVKKNKSHYDKPVQRTNKFITKSFDYFK